MRARSSVVERQGDILEGGGSTPSAPIAHYPPISDWEQGEPGQRYVLAACGAEILGIEAIWPYVICLECERIWRGRL